MASAAIHGRKALLYIGATPDKVGELREVELTIERETTDVTSHDTVGWREQIYSLAQWSMTAEALYVDGDAGQDALFAAILGETILDVEFRPEGDGTGLPNYTGSARITNWSVSGPNDDVAASSLELMGSGPITKGTQI